MARSPLVLEVAACHETVSKVDRTALVEPVVVVAVEERRYFMDIAEEVAAAMIEEASSMDIAEEVVAAIVREDGSMVYTTGGLLDNSEEVFAAVEVPWRNIIEVI